MGSYFTRYPLKLLFSIAMATLHTHTMIEKKVFCGRNDTIMADKTGTFNDKVLPNEINYGNAAFLVKGKEVRDPDSDFWKWLKGKGYSEWKYNKNYYLTLNIDWAWININSKRFAHGMPGIKVTSAVGDHAITVEEFKTIMEMFDKYEGKPPLKMD